MRASSSDDEWQIFLFFPGDQRRRLSRVRVCERLFNLIFFTPSHHFLWKDALHWWNSSLDSSQSNFSLFPIIKNQFSSSQTTKKKLNEWRQLRSLNYRHCGALKHFSRFIFFLFFITISHAKLNFCHSNEPFHAAHRRRVGWVVLNFSFDDFSPPSPVHMLRWMRAATPMATTSTDMMR